MRIDLSWTEFKNTCLTKKGLIPQYISITKNSSNYYLIWVTEDNSEYITTINITNPANSDQTDFENNYKNNANEPLQPKTEDGKIFVRAESRPLETTTCFTGIGDSIDGIGDGQTFSWDFSNNDDEITPSGVDYRRKRIEFKFLDSVWMKEGTLYFYNMPKGSYADVYIVCPTGAYYKDNNGNIHQATEDTIIAHYVMHHPMEGTVAMGDELNTECCSNEIPTYYKFWIDITIPDESGTTAHGNFEIELYRKRTRIL